MSNERGWVCPLCGRGVAPTESRCPCKEGPAGSPYTIPVPKWQPPAYPNPYIIYGDAAGTATVPYNQTFMNPTPLTTPDQIKDYPQGGKYLGG